MTRLNTSAIADALGLQGGRELPFLPVAVLADFSETLVGEFIEARGFAGLFGDVNAASTNDRNFCCALQSLAPGGLIVTDLRLSQTVQASAARLIAAVPEDAWAVECIAQTPAAIESTLASADHVDVGSGVTVSRAFTSTTQTVDATSSPSFVNGGYQIQPGTRWFVPRGSTLFLQSNAQRKAGDDVECFASITWRELAPAAR